MLAADCDAGNKQDHDVVKSIAEIRKKLDDSQANVSEQFLLVTNNAADQFDVICKQQEEMKISLEKMEKRLLDVETSRQGVRGDSRSGDQQQKEVVSGDDNSFQQLPLEELSESLARIMQDFSRVQASIESAKKQK